jgi:hypothetical protein
MELSSEFPFFSGGDAMTTKDTYLAKAAAARAKAERVGIEELQVAWLEVASAWMELAVRRKPSTAERSFDELAQTEGTRQNVSERSQ